MKINYFYGSIAIRPCDGYTENLEFNVTEGKGLTFRYPYGEAIPEEAEAISKFIKTVTDAYNVLSNQIDRTNKDLKLEQYVPTVSAEETTEVSAAPQTCALGDEEVSTGAFKDLEHPFGLSEGQIEVLKANKGANGDIDKPQPKVVTDEDIFG